MAEYIKRDNALQICDWYANKFVESYIYFKELKMEIKALPTADVQPVTWIPVTERLPKEVGWYLVVVLAPFKQVRMYEFYPVHNNYGNDLWRNNDGDHVSNWFVTHWMPLPKLPKDGET